MQHGVAVVGPGAIVNSHITGWKRIGNAELRALVGLHADSVESKAKEYGIPSYGTDYQKILDRDDIDTVDLCVPNYLHAPYTLRALEAGKHVLVEKPIATRYEESQLMIEKASMAGKKLMVAENLRFLPVHVHAKKLLAEGVIGEPFMVTTRFEQWIPTERVQGPHAGWRSETSKSGGGMFMEGAIHSVSMMRSLMGEEIESILAVRGKQVRKELFVEDTMLALFNFESGAKGQGSFSWASKRLKKVNEFTVYGTQAALGLDVINSEVWLEKDASRTTWIEPPLGSFVGQWEMIEHFVDCIDNDKRPITSGEEEAKSLRVILAGYRAAEQARAVGVNEILHQGSLH